MASGRITTHSPAAHSNSHRSPTARAVGKAAATSATSGAANATQRSCWRSMPRARRKRTTSAPAATSTARMLTTRAPWLTTSSTPPRAGTPSGLSTPVAAGSSGSGSSSIAATNTTGAAAATLAHQRQRGEGSDPVGVNSNTKPTQAAPIARVAGLYSATSPAPGSAPGRACSP